MALSAFLACLPSAISSITVVIQRNGISMATRTPPDWTSSHATHAARTARKIGQVLSKCMLGKLDLCLVAELRCDVPIIQSCCVG